MMIVDVQLIDRISRRRLLLNGPSGMWFIIAVVSLPVIHLPWL